MQKYFFFFFNFNYLMIDNKNKKIYKEFYFNLELFNNGKKKI